MYTLSFDLQFAASPRDAVIIAVGRGAAPHGFMFLIEKDRRYGSWRTLFKGGKGVAHLCQLIAYGLRRWAGKQYSAWSDLVISKWRPHLKAVDIWRVHMLPLLSLIVMPFWDTVSACATATKKLPTLQVKLLVDTDEENAELVPVMACTLAKDIEAPYFADELVDIPFPALIGLLVLPDTLISSCFLVHNSSPVMSYRHC